MAFVTVSASRGGTRIQEIYEPNQVLPQTAAVLVFRSSLFLSAAAAAELGRSALSSGTEPDARTFREQKRTRS